jgi:hypothetical protein
VNHGADSNVASKNKYDRADKMIMPRQINREQSYVDQVKRMARLKRTLMEDF